MEEKVKGRKQEGREEVGEGEREWKGSKKWTEEKGRVLSWWKGKERMEEKGKSEREGKYALETKSKEMKGRKGMGRDRKTIKQARRD